MFAIRTTWFLILSVMTLLTGGCAGTDEAVDFVDAQPRDADRRVVIDAYVPPAMDGGMGPAADAGSLDTGPAGPDAAPLPMGDPGCQALDACLDGCQDADCSLNCRNQATAESRTLYDAMFSCGTQNACHEPGGAYNTECMNEHCADELLACYGPPPPPPPPPMGQGTCDELDSCLRECVSGDLTCRDNCVAASSQMAFDQFVAAQTCTEEADCPDGDVACVLATCQGPLSACYGNVSVPRGQFDCGAYNDCLNDCMDGDDVCVSACITNTSPDGYNMYQSLISCVRASNCPNDDGDCQRAACGEQFNACFGPPPPPPMGNGDCFELNQCLNECDDDDRVCTDNCIRQTSPAAYDVFVTAINCLQNANCPPDDGDCRQMACAMEIEACVGPPVMPMGNLTCAEFNNCLVACMQGDRQCVNACVNQASPEAYRLFEAAIDCIEAAGCAAGDGACQQRACGAQINACLGL